MEGFVYQMNSNGWKEFIDQLKEDGVRICKFPETDKNGKFVDYKFLIVEFNNRFFYMQNADYETGISVTPYNKIDPFTKIQRDYPTVVRNYSDLIQYMNLDNCNRHWKKDEVHKQRIYSNLYEIHNGETAIQYLRSELAGSMEKEVLNNLEWIEMIVNTNDYCVLRFHSKNPNDWFDYEVKSRRITG